MDTIELEKKIEEKKSEIRETQFQKESEYQEVRDQIRAKYNLIGLMEQQEKEEEELEDYRKAGLIKEEDYQKALLNIKLKYAVQYVELALKAFNSLSESVSNLKDAEINQIEADYDRKIKLAGDDKKKVSKLEEEKEEKIKQTRKRYADVEFAIKIAEIVASTAVGIMKGVEQMGPILGAIFAVLTAVLGATQIASANSERQKVKSLWTGGYTGKGGKYEPKGIVHADEYVVSSDELSIPAVRSFIGGVVEPMRMRRIGYSAYTQNDTKPGTGFYNGGYSGSNKQSGMSVNDVSDLKSTMKSVRNLLNHLSQNGVVSVFDENKIYEMRQRVSKQESGEALARR
jgi:hypothetical protein